MNCFQEIYWPLARKKRVCILWFFFLSRKGGDKKSHDHELVIEFLFRIFKQFADKRRITKKLVFLLLKTLIYFYLDSRYLFAKLFRFFICTKFVILTHYFIIQRGLQINFLSKKTKENTNKVIQISIPPVTSGLIWLVNDYYSNNLLTSKIFSWQKLENEKKTKCLVFVYNFSKPLLEIEWRNFSALV